MTRVLPLGVLSLLFALLTWSACGQKPACSPQSCQGCCSADGVCKLGNDFSACGLGGNLCNPCVSPQMCTLGACAVPLVEDAGIDAGEDAGVDAGTGEEDAGPGCSATPLTCEDQSIAGLDLTHMTVASGAVTNTPEDGGFLSTIDSRAGGFPPSQGYVYARFTPTGLVKAQLSDTQAITSMDWDIAFRRFVIRLNGGDSGPSCTETAIATGSSYDQLTAEPGGLTFSTDNFVADPLACTFIDDGSGLPDSPNVALASFYHYDSCVQMTGNTFIVHTRYGQKIKLTVTTYYSTVAAQESCNAGGGGGTGGTMRVRWAYLP